MKSTGVLLFFSLLFCSGRSVYSHHHRNDCGITVEAKVTDAHQGREDGKIELVIGDDDRDQYKVFLLNRGESTARTEVRTRMIDKAGSGVYEFIIIDVKNKGCFKEYSVHVNSLQ
jgi:hypothetical protein